MRWRLAYLCGEYPRATDTFIQREIAGLRKHGMCVTTIAVRQPRRDEQGSHEQNAERARTHYLLPCSPWRLLADHTQVLFRSPLQYLRGLWMALNIRSPGLTSLLYQMFYFAEAGMLAAHLNRQRITHVHNHAPDSSGYVTMLAAQLGDLTYSLTLHGFGIFSEPRRWRLKEKLERALFVICVSHNARSQAMLWSDRRCWDRFHIVHCGVTQTRINPRTHRGRGKRLLFVGRLDSVKGLPILLAVVNRLRRDHPDLHLDIVGDGPEKADLALIVRDEGLTGHVTFHGFLSQAAISELHGTTDIAVMASFAEGVPVVLMEAMAAGLPVVAPHIAGIPELVEDGVSGFLTPAGDVEALANRIGILLRDPARRTRMGLAGRRIIEREFNLDREVARLAAIHRAYQTGRCVAVRPVLDIIDQDPDRLYSSDEPVDTNARKEPVA